LTLLEHQIRAGFWNINWLVVLTHWGSTLLETTNQRTIGGNNFQLFSNGTSSWCQKNCQKESHRKVTFKIFIGHVLTLFHII
jgi:hypothetical protein